MPKNQSGRENYNKHLVFISPTVCCGWLKAQGPRGHTHHRWAVQVTLNLQGDTNQNLSPGPITPAVLLAKSIAAEEVAISRLPGIVQGE